MSAPRVIPIPAWGQQRAQPAQVQEGNPLGPGPVIQHPGWNPSGMLPGSAIARGPEAWSGQAGHDFRSDGTNQVWRWSSPVFDLRPGVSASYGQIPAAVPINHEAALGQSIYLVVMLMDVNGVVPPATNDFRLFYTEDGSGVQGAEGGIFRLTQTIEVTDQLLAGGTSTAAPFGASPISLTPCVTALRFWRVNLTMQIAGVAAITIPYQLQASLH